MFYNLPHSDYKIDLVKEPRLQHELLYLYDHSNIESIFHHHYKRLRSFVYLPEDNKIVDQKSTKTHITSNEIHEILIGFQLITEKFRLPQSVKLTD
ncbi:hypothetical protein DERP_002196 [Dermatophagoides pteronyssinus]|uniref:Uncharacterized protein n=1 Tax=Dermatophagoides pteronyssinus TaxID=6956 RepID=A0ABQ8JH14_DERPT|nr:hypothetical protein DERP_002196 [Dermatophagoides pteronyssinus]